MTGPELLALRKRLGLSRGALASLLEVSVSQLVNYEMGVERHRKTPCPIPRVVALALVGPPIAELIASAQRKTRNPQSSGFRGHPAIRRAPDPA
jgi:transcriptional regulator with XRE-family HTH domain